MIGARRIRVCAVVIALVAAACGNGTDLATDDEGRSIPQLRGTCGNFVFDELPPDLSTFGPLDERAEAALDELINGPTGVEAQDFVGLEMVIAEQSSDSLTLLGEINSSNLAFANFEERDGTLRPTSWGGCRVEVEADGFGGARTILDPDREPDPTSTSLHVLIQERECASGQAPVDRQVIPVVTETENRIEINTLVEPVSGDAECPSNPFFPVEITLDAPLGDRVVIDGHIPPGQELSWPPDLDS